MVLACGGEGGERGSTGAATFASSGIDSAGETGEGSEGSDGASASPSSGSGVEDGGTKFDMAVPDAGTVTLQPEGREPADYRLADVLDARLAVDW